MWKSNYGYTVYMEEAGAAAAGGGDGGAAAAAAAASAGAGGEGEKSLLAAAAAAGDKNAAAAAADPHAWAPEKYRVFAGEGDKKALDLEATAKKVAAAHGELEKRMGAAGAPPEKPEGYKVEPIVEAMKKAAAGKEVPVLPEGFVKEFSAWAHKTGLSQGQFEQALPALLGFVPQLQEQAFDNLKANAQKELVKVWGADAANPNAPQLIAAKKAFMTYAPAALRTEQAMDSIGNNPLVLQILAAVGKEMGEDKRIGGEGGDGEDINAMMRTEAYWNKKHPEHAGTVRRVNEFFAAGGKAAKAA